ncbi:DUF3320 domain-containing protein [Methylobacterium bullatum]|uniref:ATP-dependent RecD-like DNA helicase n=1 Tax=Methylobacterium bullatum TaxID=570505 RepID=A0A679JDC1_9HYPH|nr:ATP-dependent RecD-like DNA helicase [Methylobacterium bullatum]
MADSAAVMVGDAPASVFQSDLPIETKIERARTELLDLSARNRLLNIPRSSKSAKIVEIVDEKSSEIFRMLLREGKAFTFLPGRASKGGSAPIEADELEGSDGEDTPDGLAQPAEDTVKENGVFSRHVDTKLQTRLTSEGLQKRLLDLYVDARTLEEEQGVNVLFLALGTLKWIDPLNASNVRYAPLTLLPVSLERGTAAERFKLRWRQEEQSANLSLEAYLERVHTIRLPVMELGEDFDPSAYAGEVAQAVATKPGWEVQPDDIVLGFFSFAKFLMYRDLDPSIWPSEARFTDRPMIRSLLSDGFDAPDELIAEDASIDPHISPADMLHIVDCDSSQSVAVHEVRQGRDIVIQGPPGTGKSQTIANIIAAAVADGRSVLFVAEKMTALDVVKRRLDTAGIGDVCLELHSNKANKRQLLDELRRTWELGAPRNENESSLIARLSETRDALNAHPARLHQPHPVARLTPYQVIGHLTRLRQDGEKPSDLLLSQSPEWTPDDVRKREDLLRELSQRVADVGRPDDHPWRGVGLEAILPTEVERLKPRLVALFDGLRGLQDEAEVLGGLLGRPAFVALDEFELGAALMERIAGAPTKLGNAALGAEAWRTQVPEIAKVLATGFAYARLASELSGAVRAEAWDIDGSGLLAGLNTLPVSFPVEGFTRAATLQGLVPRVLAAARDLKSHLGATNPVEALVDIERLVTTARRVADAPDASPEAFAATVWDRGIEQASDLAESVARLARARVATADILTDAAWTTDLGPTRQILAAKGTSLARFLSGEWRAANSLVKTVLKTPGTALPAVLIALDTLGEGKAAAALLKNEDAFGRAAFGTDWRGDRSRPEPLQALVEWMRSLRGLGAEPRLIASRLPDRANLDAQADRLARLADELRPVLAAFWADLGETTTTIFPDVAGSDRAALLRVTDRATAIASLDAGCRSIFVEPSTPPQTRVDLLKRLGSGQEASDALEGHDNLGRTAFGDAWRAKSSDWPTLSAASEWIFANDDIRDQAARIEDRPGVAKRASQASAAAGELAASLDRLFADLKLETALVLGGSRSEAIRMDALLTHLDRWSTEIEQLSKWVAYRERANQACALGLKPLVDRLADGRLDPNSTLPAFEMAFFEALFTDQAKADPALARFDGELHGRLADQFASLDKQRIAFASFEVARAHHKRIPKMSGGVGPLGVLRAEMARRRGHMPIRQLMQRAAPAIQALKPVLMMSPLSVAQFLPPGVIDFDLLVMDEASQIQPVDALGAIARARNVVVVGDEKQLPPTRFFSRMTSGAPEEEDDGAARVADIESILGLFTARGLPQRMLRWHYRSRHQSLIAVSNSQFYENKLYIVPSPYTAEAGMGLRFHHLPNGTFDSGNTGTNQVEAKALAEAVFQHAVNHPELSLGVVAFSVKQRRAIQDEVERLRRLNPETEEFFHNHPSEPFFIKNLENVQGDERDVIMISVGYGRSPLGPMAMRFGPLSVDGGERRLNVLISRAKRRCEVYASFTDEDIDLERAKGKGVFAFKLFLHFARTGRLSMAQATGRDHDSMFEEQVAKALQARGYQVHPQVGIAGFFIDLAIADSERPGRYLIGIECDGAAYHSSRSARDRDRLRQAVLEDHGWIIHRIWSTDWFQRPVEQLERTIAAIEAAKAELDARQAFGATRQRAVPVEIVTIERADVTEIGLSEAGEPGQAGPNRAYIEKVPDMPVIYPELHEAPTGVLAGLVEQVVMIEGPVHIDEVTTRIRNAWALQRTGSRIQTAVGRAIDASCAAGRVVRDGSFLSVPGQTVVARDRSLTASTALRKPEMLPPTEVRAAIREIVEISFGATPDEIVQAAARLLGFRTTGAQIKELIAGQIEVLKGEGALVPQGAMLVSAQPNLVAAS